MAVTKIADIIPADVLQDYVADELPYHSTLMSKGLVEIDSNPPFLQAGEVFTVPKVKALNSIGDDQHIEAETTLTVKGLQTYKESGIVTRWGDAVGVEDTANYAAGTDIFNSVAHELTEVVARQYEKKIIAATVGVFALAGMSTHIHDDSTNPFSVTGMVTAKAKLGKSRRKLTTAVMHSDVAAYLEQQGLVRYVDVAGFGQQVLITGEVPVIGGLMIEENDVLCAPATGVYKTYLAGGRPWYLGFQRNLRIEYDRNILLAGGTDYIKWDSHFCPHIRGVSWTGAGRNPTVADLETAANWTKVAPNVSDILLVQYKHTV